VGERETDDGAFRHSLTVPGPPERAFVAFAEGFSAWWPREYTWSQESLDTIAIEPRAGGRCFERGPEGFQCDWGRVLAWEPPHRIVFTWQIGPSREPVPNPAKAGEVEVSFRAAGGADTRVELEHRGFARHGEAGAGYREMMGSPQGWPLILDRFAESLR
jgi:uncharacterized protein YndB with AHSA1/START domain